MQSHPTALRARLTCRTIEPRAYVKSSTHTTLTTANQLLGHQVFMSRKVFLAIACQLTIACSSTTGPDESGVADISGRVQARSGTFVANTSVVLNCPSIGVSQTLQTNAMGIFGATLVISGEQMATSGGKVACQLRSPSISSPQYRADVTILFSVSGVLHPLQVVTLKEE